MVMRAKMEKGSGERKRNAVSKYNSVLNASVEVCTRRKVIHTNDHRTLPGVG